MKFPNPLAFLGLSNKSNAVASEKKSYAGSYSTLLGFDSFFKYSSNSSEFLKYYETCSPVATALKLITDNTISIPFIVQDKKADKKSKKNIDHKVLELLAKPNPYASGALFESELIGYSILTGNNYLNIIGLKEPASIFNLSPSGTTTQADPYGYPLSYTYSQNSASQTFTRKDGKFIAGQGSELSHYRNFNPRYASDNLYGVSELKACEIEIILYNLANTHNYSILKNQGRPSGILTYEGDSNLTDDQITALAKQIKGQMSGADNAGKTIFLDKAIKWQQLSESMKDMDFGTLHKRTAESIYNTLKIPLPMVSPDNMTLANMDTAKMNLFDNVIVPVKTRICEYLTAALMPRYNGSENLIITFDETEIEVLKPREVSNALRISKAGILTRNEIRESIGFDPITDERGDEIVGTNAKEEPATDQSDNDVKSLLTSLRNSEGKQLYSDEFIKDITS